MKRCSDGERHSGPRELHDSPVALADFPRQRLACLVLAVHQHKRRIAFWGHSHHARVWRKVEPDGVVEQLTGARVELSAGPATVFVVNVGTTGLPFPGKGPPSCALYDDRECWVELLALGAGRGRARELNG